jgi:hypothetical protein
MYHVPQKFGIARIDTITYRDGVVRRLVQRPPTIQAPFYNEMRSRLWTEMCSSRHSVVLKHVLNPMFVGYLDWKALSENPHPMVVDFLKNYKDESV